MFNALLYFIWDPPRIAFHLPVVGYPIAWYGILFAFGFWIASRIFSVLCDRYPIGTWTGKELTENIINFMMIGIVLGARLFHLLFYEPLDWLHADPFRLFRFWEGGLASHGGVIGILIAGYFFTRRYKLPFLEVADRVIVAALALAISVRLGNFVNQEILGTVTDIPWGVVFLHPSTLFEGHLFARHPVQLYEALYYLYLLACGVWFLSLRKPAGWTTGLIAIGIFWGRFLLEFFKEEQSVHVWHSSLKMGQWLSLPPLFCALALFVWVTRYKAAK